MYDKSALIKKYFITEINRLVSIYGFISCIEKTINEKAKIVSSSERLRFNIENDTIKNSLDFQLTKVNGANAEIIDKKIHHFSVTKIGKKRKKHNGTVRNINDKKPAKL